VVDASRLHREVLTEKIPRAHDIGQEKHDFSKMLSDASRGQ
jgi:hypothetical protein